ncbi:MAG: MOSC domain-containing protein [Betaproteobacteria bacterium]|nr:MOSC domain-containing protein [Betaproteobacteria bacterium]
MALVQGHLFSLQVGTSRLLRVGERTLRSAIHKQAIDAPVAVGPLGLAGDEQTDLSVHGGLRKAVYALPRAHLAWWSAQRAAAGVSLFGEAFAPGQLGENLSLEGVDEHSVFIGDRLCFAGGVQLRVTEPRQPCSKFNAVLGYEQAAKQMVQSGCSGFYMAVEVAGVLLAGEAFELVPGPRETSIAQALQHKAFKHLR